ncbi:MAG: glucokinase, partial [Pseudomonadota bacterium]|nr:glucokinase [Pseudomonadota bacterium]
MASRHSAAIEGWLLADVGGTHTRLASLAAGGTLGPICVTDNDRYPDLRALIASGLKTLPKDRSRLGAALAVAAPVVGDAVAMT